MSDLKENTGLKGKIEVYTRHKTDSGWSGWQLNEQKSNLIVNGGYETVVDRLFNIGANTAVYFDVFAVSNGTVTPAVTNNATTWDADGTQYRKTVQSVTYDGTTKVATVTCYLNSAENTVTSITKFALFDQTGTGGNMFNDIKFTSAKSKSSDIEIYFVYYLTLTQS